MPNSLPLISLPLIFPSPPSLFLLPLPSSFPLPCANYSNTLRQNYGYNHTLNLLYPSSKIIETGIFPPFLTYTSARHIPHTTPHINDLDTKILCLFKQVHTPQMNRNSNNINHKTPFSSPPFTQPELSCHLYGLRNSPFIHLCPSSNTLAASSFDVNRNKKMGVSQLQYVQPPSLSSKPL